MLKVYKLENYLNRFTRENSTLEDPDDIEVHLDNEDDNNISKVP